MALEIGDMQNYAEALSIIDAKSVCDWISRNASALKQDRRTAMDLAMAREPLQQVQATICWWPHTKMLSRFPHQSGSQQGQ